MAEASGKARNTGVYTLLENGRASSTLYPNLTQLGRHTMFCCCCGCLHIKNRSDLSVQYPKYPYRSSIGHGRLPCSQANLPWQSILDMKWTRGAREAVKFRKNILWPVAPLFACYVRQNINKYSVVCMWKPISPTGGMPLILSWYPTNARVFVPVKPTARLVPAELKATTEKDKVS